MVVTPVQVTFQGALQGATNEGAMTPVQFSALLNAQDVDTQMSVTVSPGDVNKLVDMPDNQGVASGKQVLFMMKSTQNVQFVLNGVPALTFAINAGFPFFIPGQPEVTQIEFTSLSATAAKVFITRVFGISTLPTIGAGGGGATGQLKINAYTATLAQTVFTLTTTPSNPTGLMFFVEGLVYTAQSGFFTVVGTTVTWSGFSLPLGARVEAVYQ